MPVVDGVNTICGRPSYWRASRALIRTVVMRNVSFSLNFWQSAPVSFDLL